jgi:hypothetical protein
MGVMDFHPTRPLSRLLRRAASRARAGSVSVGELLAEVGARGLGGVMMVLAIVSALPTFGVPVGSVMAIGLMALALQMLKGSDRVALPAKFDDMKVGGSAGRRLLHQTGRVFHRLERLMTPRWTHLASRAWYPVLGVIVLVMAVIIFLPIPLGNLVPGIATALIGAGLMAKDGLLIALGIGTSGVALVVTGFLFKGAFLAFEALTGVAIPL